MGEDEEGKKIDETLDRFRHENHDLLIDYALRQFANQNPSLLEKANEQLRPQYGGQPFDDLTEAELKDFEGPLEPRSSNEVDARSSNEEVEEFLKKNLDSDINFLYLYIYIYIHIYI